MPHTLLVYTWPYALVFWGVFLWAFAPEFRIVSRRREPSATPQDAHSKRIIAVGQGLAAFAAFTIAVRVPSAALTHRVWWFWAGLGAIVAGSLLRRHCWRMLGASFTGAVIVNPDQTVVDRGAYRYVRHPSYTAGAIMFLGIGLALANGISLAVLLGAVAIVYGYRVGVEERALVAVIGDPYRRYMTRTKRFVPFLF
jgi:protein-S-isoprenylcysteine O-methyltransferase Ste14